MSTVAPMHALAEIDLGFSAVRQAVGAPIAPFFASRIWSGRGMLAH